MRVARISTAEGPRSVIQQGSVWAVVEDAFASSPVFTGEQHLVEDARLLAPCEPAVVVGISHNLGNNDHPLPIQAFLKSSRTIAAHGDEVPYRSGIGTVNMEGELAVVIGTHCRDLTRDTAFDAVFGYTIANDVTNAGQVSIDEKFTQVKNGANYTPIGPWIETELAAPDDCSIRVGVNGVERLISSTAGLPSDLADLLVYVSTWLDLGPGDVVLTGAPATSVSVHPGDEVTIAIDGLGTLTSIVRQEFPRQPAEDSV